MMAGMKSLSLLIKDLAYAKREVWYCERRYFI